MSEVAGRRGTDGGGQGPDGERQGPDDDTGAPTAARVDVAATAPLGDSRGATPTTPIDGPIEGLRLPSGASLGRYLVTGCVGAGGMGVVFSARDPDLHRTVALKVLRPGLSAGARARARLLREARGMAQLSHPNVVQIHDVGLLGDQVFIAMELVHGTTLRDKLDRRTPWRTVVGTYLQAARGLAAAHAAGLVHRDFKPDNVLVGDDGRVRVVDFGLVTAEPVEPAQVSVAPALDAVTDMAAGTPAFMAPEVIRGELVDARADQFAFCVALFHGLYGVYPYAGATLAERATSIERGVIARPAGAAVPERVHRMVVRGLRARPEDRHPSMAVLADALEVAIAPRHRVRTIGFAAGIAAVGAVALVAVRGASSPGAPSGPRAVTTAVVGARPRALEVAHARALTLDPGCETDPVLTPDGTAVIYSGQDGHNRQIFRLDLTTAHREGPPRRVALTRGEGQRSAPSVSPDGRSFVYIESMSDDAWSFEAPIDGSAPPRRLGQGRMSPSYSPDGKAIWYGATSPATRWDRATHEANRALEPPSGQIVEAVIELPDGRVVARTIDAYGFPVGVALYGAQQRAAPRWLIERNGPWRIALSPDHTSVLATQREGPGSYALWQFPLDGGAAMALPASALVPTGGATFSRAGDRVIWSTCDTGSDVAIVEPAFTGELRSRELDQHRWRDEMPRGIAGTGLVVLRSDRDGAYGLWVVDPDGGVAPRKIDTGALVPDQPGPSHDGKLVAFSTAEGGLYVVPIDGHAPPRQLSDDKRYAHPAFGYDDKELFFEVTVGHQVEIHRLAIAGGPATLVVPGDSIGVAASPVRNEVMVLHADGDELGRLVLVDVASRRKLLTIPDFLPNDLAAFSPDGRRVAIYSRIELVEYDLQARRIVRRLRTHEPLQGLTYVPKGLVVTRHISSGDLWLGELSAR